MPAGSGAPVQLTDLTLPQPTTQQQPVPAWAREESPTWFTPGNTFSIIFFILGLFGSICQFYTTDDGWCTRRASMGTTLPGFVGAAFISFVDRNTDGGDARNRSWSARWTQLLQRKWFTPGNTLCVLASALGFFGTICQFYTDEDGWCSARAAIWTSIPGFVGAAVTAIVDRTTDGGDEKNRTWSARGRQFARIQRACGAQCVGASRACVDAIDVEGCCGACGSCLEATTGCLGECLEGCAECQCCCENGDLNGCGVFFGFPLIMTLLVAFIFGMMQALYWMTGHKGWVTNQPSRNHRPSPQS